VKTHRGGKNSGASIHKIILLLELIGLRAKERKKEIERERDE
jgi:hypothetical protein